MIKLAPNESTHFTAKTWTNPKLRNLENEYAVKIYRQLTFAPGQIKMGAGIFGIENMTSIGTMIKSVPSF